VCDSLQPRCSYRLYCCNKIPVPDLESIFQDSMKAFFAEPKRIAAHLETAQKNLSEKELLLKAHREEIQKVRDEMTRTHRLYLDGHVTPAGFGEFYKPARRTPEPTQRRPSQA